MGVLLSGRLAKTTSTYSSCSLWREAFSPGNSKAETRTCTVRVRQECGGTELTGTKQCRIRTKIELSVSMYICIIYIYTHTHNHIAYEKDAA